MALDEIRKTKIEKVKKLRKAGVDPYPAVSGRTHSISKALANFDELSGSKKEIVLAGRIMAKREHGGSVFFDINNGSDKIQALIKEDIVDKEKFEQFREFLDIGDFVEVRGTLFTTKAGEKTLLAIGYSLLAKALLPLPEKWHGLVDEEERLRKRYLDLITNPQEKEIFVKKSKFWQATRNFLIKEGGAEDETPVLELVPGGADAEPFKTHLNVLSLDLYLRISPELYLKRLIVAGYDKVFEIGRIFRNEGMDREHLQDYTQMEMYWAYADYEEMMSLVERLVRHVVTKTLGSSTHQFHDTTIDWAVPWVRIDYYEVFSRHTNLDLATVTEAELKAYADKEGIDTGAHIGRGRLMDVIFKKKVRPHLVMSGFLVLPPVDIEPLAKRWAKDQSRVERFQIVACGSELGKGFSELNDPLDQRARF